MKDYFEIENITVCLTNDCNLNCPYCFVNRNTKKMDFKTAKATMDFLFGQAKKAERLGVAFFGGEPTMEFDLIKKIIKYSKKLAKKEKKDIKFSVTTNGTLFTKEMVDFFWENKIAILFSFDGTKDQIINIKGEKAYNQMLNSINLLKQKGYSNFEARVTIGPEDMRINERIKHIQEVGFDRIAATYMSGVDEKWDQEKTNKEYLRFAKFFVQQVKQRHFIKESVFLKYIAVKMGFRPVSAGPCGAGRGAAGITTDGKILPCQHPESWLPDYELGNVFEKKLNKKRDVFLNYTKEDFKCDEDCIAKPRCIGSCFELNLSANEDIFKPTRSNCIWRIAMFHTVEYVYDRLIEKELNLFFIREMLKHIITWRRKQYELILTPESLKSQIKDWHYIFRFKETDLNRNTGKLIGKWLSKAKSMKLFIRLPIPPCIINKKTAEKYNIKTNLIFERIAKEKNKEIQKNLKKYITILKNKMHLKSACNSCVYRLRDQCDYCYFGF